MDHWSLATLLRELARRAEQEGCTLELVMMVVRDRGEPIALSGNGLAEVPRNFQEPTKTPTREKVVFGHLPGYSVAQRTTQSLNQVKRSSSSLPEPGAARESTKGRGEGGRAKKKSKERAGPCPLQGLMPWTVWGRPGRSSALNV